LRRRTNHSLDATKMMMASIEAWKEMGILDD